MFGPVIQGKLVRLRPPRPQDAEAMIDWFEDFEVTRYLKRQHPPTLEEEKEWIEQMGRDPNSVIWMVDFEGRPVGNTAIRNIDWKNGSGRTGTIIGDKSVWGKGLARELMQLRCEYAFTRLPLRKLKSAYLEGNEASARAQKAAGYREAGRWREDQFVDGQWRDHVLTEVLREDWARGRSV